MSGIVSLGSVFSSSQYSSTTEQSFVQLRGIGFTDGTKASETGDFRASEFTNKTIGFDGDWTRVDEIKLEPGLTDGVRDFGRDVAINETGNTLVVSHKIDDDSDPDGIVYVYNRSGDLWVLQNTLEQPSSLVPYVQTVYNPTGSTTINVYDYGCSVSISYSGDIIAVGASYDSGSVNRGGAVCMFSRRNGRNYTLDTIIRGSSPNSFSGIGICCAVSGDGNTVIVGGSSSSDNRVWIYTKSVLSNGSFTWTHQATISSNDAHFGSGTTRVSISENGSKVLVGAPYASPGNITRTGRSSVYVRSGSSWTLEDTLEHGDPETDDRFGVSVSLSGDGNYAICGALYEDGTGSQTSISGQYSSGSSYIFVFSGSTWTQQAKIQHSDSSFGDNFGTRVSMNDDGTVVACSAPKKGYPYPESGAVYIFTRTGSTWTEQAKIQAQDISHADWFGRCLAMSGDGSMVVIGSQRSLIQGAYDAYGAAYLYVGGGSYGVGRLTGGYGNNGTLLKRDWTKYDITKFYSNEIRGGDWFGWACSISKHGERMLVTAYYRDYRKGAAYIFQKTSENTWVQQADLDRDTPDVSTSASPAQDQLAYSYGYLRYGWSCAISADGNMAAVGATSHTRNGLVRTGAVTIWRQHNFNWYHMQLLEEPTPTQNRYFGSNVALSDTGDMVVVGAGITAGKIWVFQLTGNSSQGFAWNSFQTINSPESVTRSFGSGGIAISGSGDTIVVSQPFHDYVVNGVALIKSGSAYVYDRSGSSYTLTTNLRNLTTDAAEYDYFGGDTYQPTRSVSISADGNTIAIGAVYKDTTETPQNGYVYSGPGQVYIFVKTNGVWSEQAKLKPNNISNDHRFGEHVSLSENGDRLIVGCPSAYATGGWPSSQYAVAGNAHIFTRTGTVWTETQLITAPGVFEAGSQVGSSVSMSASGEYAVVGGYRLKIETPPSEWGPGASSAVNLSGAAFIVSAQGPAI